MNVMKNGAAPFGVDAADEDRPGTVASAALVSDGDARGRLHMVAMAAAMIGAPLFLLAVLLHPGRDGWSIAAAGNFYGITHGLEAMGLVIVAMSLIAFYALAADRFGTKGLLAFFTSVAGTVFWFGLLVLDGTRNPVTARYTPAIVHTAKDLDPGVLIVSLPALIVFPIGYVLLALVLARHGMRWPGLLIGVGAVLYWSGAIPLFAFGPRSPDIAVLEIAGALAYAIGFVLLARSREAVSESGPVSPRAEAFE